MEDLITFIDSFAMDDQLYWQLPLLDSQKYAELVWSKAKDKNRWSLRLASEEEWQSADGPLLVSLMKTAEVDLEQAKRILGASVVTQAVFASLVVEAAEKLFGQEALQQAFTDTNRFLASLLQSVKNNVPPHRQHLKVIKK